MSRLAVGRPAGGDGRAGRQGAALDRQPVEPRRDGAALERDDLDELLLAVEHVVVAHERVHRLPEPEDRAVGPQAGLRLGRAGVGSQRVEALTIRRLADAVGVGTMTIYVYFRDKDELLDAAIDAASGRVSLTTTGRGETASSS